MAAANKTFDFHGGKSLKLVPTAGHVLLRGCACGAPHPATKRRIEFTPGGAPMLPRPLSGDFCFSCGRPSSQEFNVVDVEVPLTGAWGWVANKLYAVAKWLREKAGEL